MGRQVEQLSEANRHPEMGEAGDMDGWALPGLRWWETVRPGETLTTTTSKKAQSKDGAGLEGGAE